ncbi:hypothetical protein HYU19_04090 [Candidatus Woesearchaeota archaeon]|nr:hypothetical protein [Candidatus Woesearchaeota archaeon]
MLSANDQLQLFKIISTKISRDISCYAFGGNAMMFYGFKDETKDVDLLFEHEEDRQEFIKALRSLGFEEKSVLTHIYIPEKLRDPHRPLMYIRDDTRFDLFVKKIFKTLLSPRMKEDVYAVHEFKEKHLLKVRVFRSEIIVMLKSVTERTNDFDDIRTIASRNVAFDWQYLIDEAIWQYQHGDSWVIIDMEKTLQELKKYVFVEEKYLQQLYAVVKQKKERKK